MVPGQFDNTDYTRSHLSVIKLLYCSSTTYKHNYHRIIVLFIYNLQTRLSQECHVRTEYFLDLNQYAVTFDLNQTDYLLNMLKKL